MGTALVADTDAAEITLSPNGPIRTLQAARDAARIAEHPVRIVIDAGTYPLTQLLELGAEDSEVHWVAAPGARPVIEAGRAITGWRQTADGLWRAPVPEAKAGWNFEQLWINGRRATRARTPNKGFYHIVDKVPAGIFPGVEVTSHRAFALEPEHFSILKNIPASQRDDALLTVMHSWSVGQCRIEALDEDSSSILIKGGSRYPFVEREANQRIWMENFRSALDAPGEWFLDREAGELLYKPMPDDRLADLVAMAPVVSQFLKITGASNVTFEGLAFLHCGYNYPANGLHDGQAATTVGGSIEVENSHGIRMENCEVGHTGEYAIYFKNGCHDSLVKHCHLHDLGAGGVRIGDTAKPSEERINRRIIVDDCIMQHGGRLHPSACGLVMTHVQQCEVTHCDIGDFYYSGVSAGWTWGYGESLARANRIENNHIHHLGWAYLSDMGGFYNLGTVPGTVVRGNHIHHIASFRYGGWGLYTDEGSTDVLMENNLVHDTSDAGFHQHYGYYNTVRNNILAFGKTAQVRRSRAEPRLSFIFERNIVVWDPDSPLLDGGEANWSLNANKGELRDAAIFRRNLYWRTDGKMPEKLAETWTWEEWKKMGRDAGSLFADPQFENLADRDFRLKADTPAAKIAFQPWDLSVAGVRNSGAEGAAWRALATEGHHYPNWSADARPWPAPDYQLTLQTFERTPLGAMGIRQGSFHDHKKGESIGVTDEAASPLPVTGQGVSKRSLKILDAPNLPQSFYPILDVHPNWEAGTLRAQFDVMAQPGANWFFEMRTDGGGEYGAGPMVSWKNGELSAGLGDQKKLAKIPTGEWARITVTATTESGTFDVDLLRQDGTRQEFNGLPCKPTWDKAHYLLWSSLGTTSTAFFLDNLSLTRVPLAAEPVR